MDNETGNSGVLFRFNSALEGIPNSLAYEVNIDWRKDIQGPLGTIEHACQSYHFARFEQRRMEYHQGGSERGLSQSVN